MLLCLFLSLALPGCASTDQQETPTTSPSSPEDADRPTALTRASVDVVSDMLIGIDRTLNSAAFRAPRPLTIYWNAATGPGIPDDELQLIENGLYRLTNQVAEAYAIRFTTREARATGSPYQSHASLTPFPEERDQSGRRAYLLRFVIVGPLADDRLGVIWENTGIIHTE